MTRDQINQQPAQLIRINNHTSTVLKEGTRGECWRAEAQTISRCFHNDGNTIVVLKKK